MWPLVLAALGVVYGDIGTSPLYAIKLCFSGHHGISPSEENIIGVMSLVFWSVSFVVAFKYLWFVLRADNHGEGGILALLAVASRRKDRTGNGPPTAMIILVLFGAALLFGDGIITPAISVLSAVEGLSVATKAAEPYVLPITTGILLALFLIQKKGTGNIGRVFGVVMIVWFSSLAVIGLAHILRHPHVLRAIHPLYAVEFVTRSGSAVLWVLGGVFLCVTGTEAMYADMGHFGRPAIRRGWFGLVMPSLVLNYFGQGALLLGHPEYAESPFYYMVPRWGLYPMVVLATAATIIASQALISGAFSLNRQAMQLGYCPRLTVVHTSSAHEGQIYIPEVNWTLMVSCIALVWGFRTSENLAAAYGIAVTGDMVITTCMFYVVTRRTWDWAWWRAAMLAAAFLAVDLTFLTANSLKFFQGGWAPILMALCIFTLMTTWKDGRKRLAKHFAAKIMPLEEFLKKITERKTPRVPGTAVFLTANPTGVPPILVHHWEHIGSLHERIVLLSIMGSNVPRVAAKHRLAVRDIGQGFHQVSSVYGYMQTPNVPVVLQSCEYLGLPIDPKTVTYFLGRETLMPYGRSGMPYWRKVLFILISRNSRSATAYFGIPAGQVEELGMQVEL
ncbi:MAG: potassium transporter Kup [Candidatus Lindowbacteria bacterium RIFCSPLOWO2_12_FULL_62_27]|nr:MAG: potassium transporter Kup [Candidatus Lindowbacteria bacterium RIFCSPLOWO2_02_FULL_62_12]OGH63321.1 MAG: potassium transporter Kup [Candidatus Lindowbacteria bacterium RIFCSPLOWO2_12_FULL_62_27]